MRFVKLIVGKLDQLLKITRSFAFNGVIEGDCPGSVCLSPGLAQSNPPTNKKGVSMRLGTERIREKQERQF